MTSDPTIDVTTACVTDRSSRCGDRQSRSGLFDRNTSQPHGAQARLKVFHLPRPHRSSAEAEGQLLQGPGASHLVGSCRLAAADIDSEAAVLLPQVCDPQRREPAIGPSESTCGTIGGLHQSLGSDRRSLPARAVAVTRLDFLTAVQSTNSISLHRRRASDAMTVHGRRGRPRSPPQNSATTRKVE